jgi:hypothetical protein
MSVWTTTAPVNATAPTRMATSTSFKSSTANMPTAIRKSGEFWETH